MRVQYGRGGRMRWFAMYLGPIGLIVRLDGHINDSKVAWSFGDYEWDFRW